MGRAGSEGLALRDGAGGVGDPGEEQEHSLIGTFGLTVKLGSATLEILVLNGAQIDKRVLVEPPRGGNAQPLLGRRVSPSLAEFTIREPD